MKAHMYTDGKKRVGLRVTHHLGAYDFVNFLCYKHREDDDEGVDALPDYSRLAIVDIIRNQLMMNADAPNWWQDDVEDEWEDEVQQWAEELVRRRFPEFY